MSVIKFSHEPQNHLSGTQQAGLHHKSKSRRTLAAARSAPVSPLERHTDRTEL